MLNIYGVKYVRHTNSLFSLGFFAPCMSPIRDEDLQDDAEIFVKSGDAAVLRNKRIIEGLRLDRLQPESELVHSTWESELRSMAQLLAVDIPSALQEARVLVELRTAHNSGLCTADP